MFFQSEEAIFIKASRSASLPSPFALPRLLSLKMQFGFSVIKSSDVPEDRYQESLHVGDSHNSHDDSHWKSALFLLQESDRRAGDADRHRKSTVRLVAADS